MAMLVITRGYIISHSIYPIYDHRNISTTMSLWPLISPYFPRRNSLWNTAPHFVAPSSRKWLSEQLSASWESFRDLLRPKTHSGFPRKHILYSCIANYRIIYNIYIYVQYVHQKRIESWESINPARLQ